MGVIKPLNQRIYKFILKNLIVIGVGTSLKSSNLKLTLVSLLMSARAKRAQKDDFRNHLRQGFLHEKKNRRS